MDNAWSNLQIHCNPYQNSNNIFHISRKKNPKIWTKPQKTSNSPSNLEKEEQSWRHHVSWFQTILQSYSNQNSMVLAQKQPHRSMEQNREPRNKPTYVLPINLFFNTFVHSFIYLWLCWVFVAAHGLSLVAECRGYSSLQCAGFPLQWLLLLWSMGSRRAGFSSCGMQAQ